MKKIILSIALLGGVFCTSHIQAQVVLEALEASGEFVPSDKCLEQVKDKYYGNGTHNFIYCAVMGPNGKKWLNLNLGAEYAREPTPDNPNPSFNPEAVPTDYNDWKAFGSLYNYSRDSDGHEHVEYQQLDGMWIVRPKKGYVNENVGYRPGSYAGLPMFIGWNHSSEWWRNMDPCPTGYQVMTRDDIIAATDYVYDGSPAQTSVVKSPSHPFWNLVTSPAVYGMFGSEDLYSTRPGFLNTISGPDNEKSRSSTVWLKKLVDMQGVMLKPEGWVTSTLSPIPIQPGRPYLDRGLWDSIRGYVSDLVVTHHADMNNASAVRCVSSN